MLRMRPYLTRPQLNWGVGLLPSLIGTVSHRVLASIMRLSIDLTDLQKEHLEDLAARLRVAPEILAAAALRDLLARREADFETAANRVLEKNTELYRRLA